MHTTSQGCMEPHMRHAHECIGTQDYMQVPVRMGVFCLLLKLPYIKKHSLL